MALSAKSVPVLRLVIVFSDILGYPKRLNPLSFVFNNIVGYTFILTYIPLLGYARPPCSL